MLGYDVQHGLLFAFDAGVDFYFYFYLLKLHCELWHCDTVTSNRHMAHSYALHFLDNIWLEDVATTALLSPFGIIFRRHGRAFFTKWNDIKSKLHATPTFDITSPHPQTQRGPGIELATVNQRSLFAMGHLINDDEWKGIEKSCWARSEGAG